jgi:iron complex outermembrane receptor protein
MIRVFHWTIAVANRACSFRSHTAQASAKAPFNVSVGVEQRRETYSVAAGDEASCLDGGSQALPGLAPVSASDSSRNVLGTYIDLSTHLAPKWMVDLAGRFEHYSDVGDTTNGKISTRYDFHAADRGAWQRQ